MCTYITNFFIEIPPCAKKVIFSTEFVLLDLNPHFYEVNQEVWKRPCAWRNFKNIFCVLSGYPKKPFRTEKPSIFNFRYVKEVWASGLLGVKAKVCQQNPAPGMFCSFNMIWYNKILPILKARADILTTISLFFWKFDTSQFCSEIIWLLVLTFAVSELRVGKKCSSRFRQKFLQ